MKVLVAIANHGFGNQQYAEQLLAEYSSMSFDVDIVVISNVPKEFDAKFGNIEVVVGAPIKDPWSLPFRHRELFAERVDDYDLFIYTEDDTLLTEQHVRSFLAATEVLEPDEIPGFLRSETDAEGRSFISSIHSHYHWDPATVRQRGEQVFAFFTNHHGAAYILTQDHLRRAIASGGFMVPPHKGLYDMLVSAATDPYTQCGMTKLISLTNFEEFVLPHLSSKYLGKMGMSADDNAVMLRTLVERKDDPSLGDQLVEAPTKLPENRFSTNYYQRCREDLLPLVPEGARSVLSIGCTNGTTERALAARGATVTAVPVDHCISALARAHGIETVAADLDKALAELGDRRFDAIVSVDLVHLVRDPQKVFAFGKLLEDDGVFVVTAPNMKRLAWRMRGILGSGGMDLLGEFDRAGMHRSSPSWARGLATSAGLHVDRVLLDPSHQETTGEGSTGLLAAQTARTFALIARRGGQ